MDNPCSFKPPLVVGLKVKNKYGEIRTIVCICKTSCERGKCPSGYSPYGQTGYHIWFDSRTYTYYEGKEFWEHYTLISPPERELITKSKSRFELIND